MQLAAFIWSVLASAVLIFAADALFQPIPIPAGAAIVFGWLAWWVGRRRVRLASIGAIAGLLIGAIAHVRSHVVEDRVESVASLSTHVALDAALSLATAAVALVIALAPSAWLDLKARRVTTGDRRPASAS